VSAPAPDPEPEPPAAPADVPPSVPDFAVCEWLFDENLVAQKREEAELLWRGARDSGGPILEIGRMAGGTTVILLEASGDRPVASIDFAPFHVPHTDEFFERPDIRPRVKLYVQSSRDPIPENEFGYLFIDGDHSYEGVCADIANFWGTLRSFDGKPALCAFHDAAEPGYVTSVKKAVDELIAEPGACRVVETAASMMLVEKTGEIDSEKWRRKVGDDMWRNISDPHLDEFEGPGRWSQIEPPGTARPDSENYVISSELHDIRQTKGRWRWNGLLIEKPGAHLWGGDNRIYAISPDPEQDSHHIQYIGDLVTEVASVTAYIRPKTDIPLRLSAIDENGHILAHADYRFLGPPRVENSSGLPGTEVLGTWMSYETGFFECNLMIGLERPCAIGLRIDFLEPFAPDAAADGKDPPTFYLNAAGIRRISR
jgi:predicted O-methyltransferase YrrM